MSNENNLRYRGGICPGGADENHEELRIAGLRSKNSDRATGTCTLSIVKPCKSL